MRGTQSQTEQVGTGGSPLATKIEFCLLGSLVVRCDGVVKRPVLVLTAARSEPTLLRPILDAHPELACPPAED